MNGLPETEEVWKSVPSFPDYEASSLGRIKRVVGDAYGRGVGRILTPSACTSHRYLVVTLHRNRKQSGRLVHRLVCEDFHGMPPSKRHQAAHGDGNPHNNAACNLRWASPAENNMDKHRHGSMKVGSAHHANAKPECMPRGSSHGNVKLSDDAVVAIRNDGRSQKRIAEDYGVSQSLISMVKRRQIWTHIQ